MDIKRFILAAGMAVFASAALADAKTFKDLDADADGVISSAEAAADEALLANWKALDANKDNVLDETEFSAFEAQ